MTQRSDELWTAARGQDPATQVDLARVERRLERTVDARRGRSRASWLALGGLLLGGAAVAAMVEVQARAPQAALEALEAPPQSAAPHQRRVLYSRRAEPPAPEPRATAPAPRAPAAPPPSPSPSLTAQPREALVLHGPATTTTAVGADEDEAVERGVAIESLEAPTAHQAHAAPIAPSLRAPSPTRRAPAPSPAYAPRAVRERADDDTP
jgi:hypothetical protein